MYQDVVEYVEQIEYKPVDVYVWQVELIDEEFVQKDVQDKGTATPVEVDQVTIEKKAVKIPRLKYNYRDVLIHDPVEIIQTPGNSRFSGQSQTCNFGTIFFHTFQIRTFFPPPFFQWPFQNFTTKRTKFQSSR